MPHFFYIKNENLFHHYHFLCYSLLFTDQFIEVHPRWNLCPCIVFSIPGDLMVAGFIVVVMNKRMDQSTLNIINIQAHQFILAKRKLNLCLRIKRIRVILIKGEPRWLKLFLSNTSRRDIIE